MYHMDHIERIDHVDYIGHVDHIAVALICCAESVSGTSNL